MNKKNDHGENTIVKLIDPITLADRDAEEVVIVNRIRLNNKLVEFEIKDNHSSNIVIVKNAIKAMKKKEFGTKRIALGAEMKIADVLKVFPEYKTLPKNSIYERGTVAVANGIMTK